MECQPTNILKWYEENKSSFSPPICNKLMHKGQVSIMFVGGPNTRKDFHLEEGSEFFFQIKGKMELPIVEKGIRRLITINEGEVFLLPSRIPHSPQRPVENSLGLVIERKRIEGEKDGLRFYVDFEKCNDILWEKYFICNDLGKDLVPVVQAFKESEECKTGKNCGNEFTQELKQDLETEVPLPFNLLNYLETTKEKIEKGCTFNLFENHPDKEFSILVNAAGPNIKEESLKTDNLDTWFYQIEGSISIFVSDQEYTLNKGDCCVVQPKTNIHTVRSQKSIGLIVQQNFTGNKK